MTARRSLVHRAAAATVGLAAATALAWGVSSTAAADPPGLDFDPCAATLARANLWPGTIPVDGQDYRVVSDGYVSYLAGQAACQSAAAE